MYFIDLIEVPLNHTAFPKETNKGENDNTYVCHTSHRVLHIKPNYQPLQSGIFTHNLDTRLYFPDMDEFCTLPDLSMISLSDLSQPPGIGDARYDGDPILVDAEYAGWGQGAFCVVA